MLAIALISMFCFVAVWLIFSLLAYSAIYGSLIVAYLFVWDDTTRRQICPKGLIHALLYDE
jgi:hypothetical protein